MELNEKERVTCLKHLGGKRGVGVGVEEVKTCCLFT